MDGDLISRSALLEKAHWYRLYPENSCAIGAAAVDVLDIQKAPAVDAVEVVRCKDCGVPHNKWTGCPNLNGLVPPPDFFCAKGERREENAAD